MLGIPPATKFDLNFRLLNIPVRVSVWFWVVALMFNIQDGPNVELLIWVACMFVSILVHEFGHALTSKSFGDRPFVVLHGMGGVSVSDTELPFGKRLAVLFMGPGAQFILLGSVFVYAFLAHRIGIKGDWFMIRLASGFPEKMTAEVAEELMGFSRNGFFTFYCLVRINVLWPVINLLPIWPLDGGQITQTIMARFDRVHGMRRAHIIGMVTAGIITAYLASRIEGMGDGMTGFFPVIFFGYFALLNYRAVQAYHQHYVQNGPDDADWWKR